MAKITRRLAIAGGSALALTGIAVLATRPAEQDGDQGNPYFNGLSKALQTSGLMKPTLVIDLQRLDRNIAAIRASVNKAQLPLRVVAKSLPAPQLLDRVMEGVGTDRLMLFSTDMLLQLSALKPQADILMGKPLPASEFSRYIASAGKASAAQVQWLIDSPERLVEYAAIATAQGVSLRANFEIDIGLHRGGIRSPDVFATTLELAQQHKVTASGLMGYDPFVPKVPNPDKAYAASQAAYGRMIDVMRAAQLHPAQLTLNAAGSPTFRMHCKQTIANEVSVGSAFVKPVDFDYTDLQDLLPAAFIATPVLKAAHRQELPGLEGVTGLLHWYDRNAPQGFFVHGGHWLATPEWPRGLQNSSLFGRSSNQELLTGSSKIRLKPDDIVFFRPNQSEALFLQFGDIAIFDGKSIPESWKTLPISA